jgi:AcrR family transcriptional regulator
MIAQDTAQTGGIRHRDRVRAMMRRDILDAARRIIREKGMKDLSMRGLGQAVGVSATTLYDYFPRKEGVLDALFVEGVERLHSGFEEAIAGNDAGLPQLRGIGLAYRRFAHEEPVLFQLIFGRAALDYRPDQRAKSRAAALFDLLVSVIVRAIEAGQVRPEDPATIGLATWAAVHGFVTLEINGFLKDCSPLEPDTAFDATMLMLLGGLRR